MRCSGKYIFQRQEIECKRKWACKNYSFRGGRRETPKSKTHDCEYFDETISTT